MADNCEKKESILQHRKKERKKDLVLWNISYSSFCPSFMFTYNIGIIITSIPATEAESLKIKYLYKALIYSPTIPVMPK